MTSVLDGSPVAPPAAPTAALPRCPHCGSVTVESLGEHAATESALAGARIARYRCATCALEYVEPEPALLARLYPDAYYSKRRRCGLPARLFGRIEAYFLARRAALVLRHYRRAPGAPAPRVLDVGCGNGGFLAAMARAGCVVTGIDTSPAACESAARDHGIEVYCGELASHAAAIGDCDIVTAWHVLEHIADTRSAFDAMVERLRPGGLLCLAVPNGAALLARLGPAWAFYDHPRHLRTFQPEHLLELAAGAGLAIVQVTSRSLEYELPVSLLTALNLSVGERMLLYYWLKRDVAPPARVWASCLPGQLLVALTAPIWCLLSLGASHAGRGNNLCLIARRPVTPATAARSSHDVA